MPTYDYECTQCGHVFEQFHGINDEPEIVCPECGGPVKRRIGTGAGIIFKGGGFYITENRSKAYKDQAKSESTSSVGGEKKSESSSKPETSTKPESSPTPAPAPTPAKKPATE
jgi:putative FmdB family regulatory protein